MVLRWTRSRAETRGNVREARAAATRCAPGFRAGGPPAAKTFDGKTAVARNVRRGWSGTLDGPTSGGRLLAQAAGAGGPACDVCGDGFQETYAGRCARCGRNSSRRGQVFVILAALALSVACRATRRTNGDSQQNDAGRVARLRLAFKLRAKWRILFVAAQLLATQRIDGLAAPSAHLDPGGASSVVARCSFLQEHSNAAKIRGETAVAPAGTRRH